MFRRLRRASTCVKISLPRQKSLGPRLILWTRLGHIVGVEEASCLHSLCGLHEADGQWEC